MPDLPMRLVSILAVVLGTACTTAGTPERVRLCDALARVQPGEHMEVVVRGVIASGPELLVLFDPDEPACRENVQPATWVELGPNADATAMNREGSGNQVRVVVQGVLHGPRVIADEGRGDPVFAARARAHNRRYGHLNTFRTKLVVERVLSADPVSETATANWNAVPMSSEPVVVSASVPAYPELARAAGVTGDVRLVVTVVRGNVSHVEVQSGDRMLAQHASENAKNWRFQETVDGTIETTFRYRLERRKAGADLNPRIELSLPRVVTIVGATDDW
jgi:Gram-negative bacterial TonB protein C-terminal